MWRNDAQACRAIRVLLGTLFDQKRVNLWWRDDGPTKTAVKLYERKGGSLSHGESILFMAAFDLWNGEGGVRLSDVLHVLDTRRTEALCSLIVAHHRGSLAIEGWLREYDFATGAVT